MTSDTADLDAIPNRAGTDKGVEFPLPSLRKFLIPSQLVFVKSFSAASLEELDAAVNKWAIETASIIAVPSSVTQHLIGLDLTYSLTLTYVSSTGGTNRD